MMTLGGTLVFQGVGPARAVNVFGTGARSWIPWSAPTDLHRPRHRRLREQELILALQPMTRLVAAVPLTKSPTRRHPSTVAEEHDNRTQLVDRGAGGRELLATVTDWLRQDRLRG